MTMETAVAKALENFNPDNPFHIALKKYGEHSYNRVIEMATESQRFAIAEGHPIVEIAEAVRTKALEIFADERKMRGMRLEDELGL
ncbi:hypothetical protein [Pseudomonas putida]|uniref:hypothetical protein n=1 Tax=Pseudomonas putida TaxID=303 RepID=UPI002169988A|nr:hypothetical protein [Pseudomonas putida]MCS4061731.1 hypothetical protein [Pseudomonas putida]